MLRRTVLYFVGALTTSFNTSAIHSFHWQGIGSRPRLTQYVASVACNTKVTLLGKSFGVITLYLKRELRLKC